MSSTVQRLTRVFRVSTQTLPDPAPTETPERAFAMLAVGMPALAHYTLEPPVIENGQMVFTALRPPAQIKGARRTRANVSSARSVSSADDVARKALDAWADSASTAQYDVTLHAAVGHLLAAIDKREPGAGAVITIGAH